MALLLTGAAHFSSKPEVTALASRVLQGLMFKSVGRGFINGQAHADPESPHASSAPEVRECWHLSAEDHSLLVTESLLPLAGLHAAAVLSAPGIVQQAERGEAAPHGTSQSLGKPAQPAKWSAPQLSQLVHRLDAHGASSALQTGDHLHAKGVRPRPQTRLAMRSAAQPELQGSEGSAAAARDIRAGCIAAAAPAHALLSCLTAEARMFLTADPMPFANAEAPLQNAARSGRLSPKKSPGDSSVSGEFSRLQEEDQQQHRSSGSAQPKQAGGALLSKARSMARQLQLPGRHRSELQRPRIMRAEVATVREIQIHIAGLIDVSTVCPALWWRKLSKHA